MRLSFNLISLFFFISIDISTSNSSIKSMDLSKKFNFNRNIYLINDSKIGVVDFRNILKESYTMKKLVESFLNLKNNLMIK